MIRLLPLLILFGQTSGNQMKGEPPQESRVKGSGVERTIAEFMDVCIRPMFDEATVRTAVAESDFAYVSPPPNSAAPTSFRWRSTRAILALELNINGADAIAAQCALSIGSIQPRSGDQIAAVLRPALESELGVPVRLNVEKDEVMLSWPGRALPFRYRITLVGSATQPHQAQWYVLDKLSPTAGRTTGSSK